MNDRIGNVFAALFLCVLHTVRAQTASSGCDAGSFCCTLPPCRCGTYVTCLANTNCLSAVCEICPPGSYCTCEAACPKSLTSTPSNLIRVCPSGYYCPMFSGRPTPCPAGTYGDKTGLKALEDCKKCQLLLDSSEGSSKCKLSNAGIAVICASCGGSLVIGLLCYVGMHWRRLRARQAESRFLESTGPQLKPPANFSPMESYGTDDDTSSDRLYPGDSMEPTAPIAKVLSADERREQLRRRMEELERQESIKAVAKGKVILRCSRCCC